MSESEDSTVLSLVPHGLKGKNLPGWSWRGLDERVPANTYPPARVPLSCAVFLGWEQLAL